MKSEQPKRARDEPSSFTSPHHESCDLPWDQERQLRLSCDFRHLRHRHVDDLATVIHKICEANEPAAASVLAHMEVFSKRDNVNPALASNCGLSPEQAVYARRISEDVAHLHLRYPGDLAQIVESLVQSEYCTKEWVTKELQRINIVQSDARKKLRH